MVSRQHQDWLNKGKPDSGLALPLQLMANSLSAVGYLVYVYPNDEHLDAQPPEDHTYYSETGWPLVSPKWWRHAIDIMPPPAGSHLPSLQTIGQNIFNAREAGNIKWVKYMNWPSDGNLNRAVHDSWKPDHSRGSSSDVGHIHLSSITGCEVLDEHFDPLQSVITVGTTPTPLPGTPQEDNEMTFLAQGSDGTLYLVNQNAMESRAVTTGQLGDLVTLINEGLIDPIVGIGGNGTAAPKGKAEIGGYFPRKGWTTAFGPLPAAGGSISITGQQLDTMASTVSNAVVSTITSTTGVVLTASQIQAATEAAVRDVLLHGVNLPNQ